jgi:hypothetical protein
MTTNNSNVTSNSIKDQIMAEDSSKTIEEAVSMISKGIDV